jgi:hypothetical protein
MADYYLRTWTPSGGQSRDSSPDILVWDKVIKTISASSQGRDTVGLLLGSAISPAGGGHYVVTVEDIVPARPLTGPNGQFDEIIVADLLDDWLTDFPTKQVLGWFRTISTPPGRLRLQDDDQAIHLSHFRHPYQVALVFSQQSTDVYLSFFKSDRGNLDVERNHGFVELSDSSRALPIRNLNVSETAQQGSGSGGGGGRQPSQSFQLPLPLILRLGLPILILLAVLTPLLLHFGVIDTGGTPAGSGHIIELTIPAADGEGMSRIKPAMLDGPAEGITSITFMNLSQDENQEDGTLWIERVPVNPLGSDPPGGFIDYAYYSITSRDTDDQTTIEFEFGIPESWKELRDVGKDTIRAYKDSGDGWTELTDISEVSLIEKKYVFKAYSVGFSYFALGGTRANQPVSVTVKIPENYELLVDRIRVAKGACTESSISVNNPFTCELGTELVLGLDWTGTTPGFTEWSIGARKYSLRKPMRLVSDTTITAVIRAQSTPRPDPTSPPPYPTSPPPLGTGPQATTVTPQVTGGNTSIPPSPPDPTSPPPDPTSPPGSQTTTVTSQVTGNKTSDSITVTPTEETSLVRVRYKVSPPESGKIIAYQSFQKQLECKEDEVPPEGGYFAFLCPEDREIQLSANPNKGYQFVSMDIQANDGDRLSYIGNSFLYKLESTDITINVNFKENE